MSVLATAAPDSLITDALLAAARPLFAAAIWNWFDANRGRVLFSHRLLWFGFTVVLDDLRPLVSEIAGPDPRPIG